MYTVVDESILLTSQIQSSPNPIKPSPRKPFPRKHLDPIRNTLCSLNRRSKAMDRGKEPDIEDKDIIEGLQQEDKDEYFKPTRASRTTIGCKQCQDIIALRTRCTACFPLPLGVQNIRFFINITHYDGFSGMGIPSMALVKAMCVLWNLGIQCTIQKTFTCEIDPDAIKLHKVLVNQRFSNPTDPIPVQQLQEVLRREPTTKGFILSMLEMVPAPIYKWQQNIMQHFGTRFLAQVPPHQAARDRNYFTIPRNIPNLQHLSQPGPRITGPRSMPDGSTWPAYMDLHGKHPPTIRAAYPQMVQRGQDASYQDRRTLRLFQTRNPNTNQVKYAGVPKIAHWLGLSEADIRNILSQFPCQQPECGAQNFCENCQRALTVLGRAWNLDSATNHIASIIGQMCNMIKDKIHLPDNAFHIHFWTAGPPCTKISRGIFSTSMDPQQPVGPHAFPSNLMWTWHEIIVSQAKQIAHEFNIHSEFAQHNCHVCSHSCSQADIFKNAIVERDTQGFVKFI